MTDREQLDAALGDAVDTVRTDMCCTTCTTSGNPVGTYAGYHAQDIERSFSDKPGGKPVGDFLDGEELSAYDIGVHLVAPIYITFGIQDAPDAMPREDRGYDRLGARIVSKLKTAGFDTDWTGSADQKIKVIGISTYRRLA
jgi:hypothetical protein